MIQRIYFLCLFRLFQRFLRPQMIPRAVKWYQAVLTLRKASFQNGIDLQMKKVSKWNAYVKGLIKACHLFLLLLLLHTLLNSSYQPHTFITMLNKIRRWGKPELVVFADSSRKIIQYHIMIHNISFVIVEIVRIRFGLSSKP